MENFARCCGYAVYAVAYADKSIETEEKEAIHHFLNENWINVADNTDPFGVKAIEFIECMVDALAKEKLSPKSALDRFEEQYFALNNSLTDQQRQFILDLTIKTGNAFNRMNKSELVMLSKLEGIIHLKD